MMPAYLGSCCVCRRPTFSEEANLLQLPHKAPVPGWGWGCVACELKPDGAVAIVCDECRDAAETDGVALSSRLKDICKGAIFERGRASVTELRGRHAHRPTCGQDLGSN